MYAFAWCGEGGEVGHAAHQYEGGGEGYLGWASVGEGRLESEAVIDGKCNSYACLFEKLKCNSELGRS